MKSQIKKLVLGCVFIMALPLRLIPASLRRQFLFGLLVMESRVGNSENALRQLFIMEDKIRLLINERAMVLGQGVHPKHRLMNYHRFFVENIAEGDTVLDIGCGYGSVARSVAQALPSSNVTGIDFNQDRIDEAQGMKNTNNLNFVCGDALQALPSGNWDVVMMSNVLEHIEGRVDFLRHMGRVLAPGKLLIRVPQFERDWTLPMRKELGINYFSDPTHFIEHTQDEFLQEMDQAGIDVIDQLHVWGEIWAVCRYRMEEAKDAVNA